MAEKLNLLADFQLLALSNGWTKSPRPERADFNKRLVGKEKQMKFQCNAFYQAEDIGTLNPRGRSRKISLMCVVQKLTMCGLSARTL